MNCDNCLSRNEGGTIKRPAKWYVFSCVSLSWSGTVPSRSASLSVCVCACACVVQDELWFFLSKAYQILGVNRTAAGTVDEQSADYYSNILVELFKHLSVKFPELYVRLASVALVHTVSHLMSMVVWYVV